MRPCSSDVRLCYDDLAFWPIKCLNIGGIGCQGV